MDQEPCTLEQDLSDPTTSLAAASTSTTTSTTTTTTTTTTTSTTTSTTTTTTTTTTSTTTPATTTSTTSLIDQTAILIEMHDSDIAEAVVDFVDGHSGDDAQNQSADIGSQSCDSLNTGWACSNGSQNLSLCFKSCSNGDTEQKRCICIKGSCTWYQKGSQCTNPSIPLDTPIGNPDWTLPMNLPTMTGELPTTNESNLSGNLPLENISNSVPNDNLMSLVHQINLANTGYINVNFQLR